MLPVIEYFAKSFKVTQDHSKWHQSCSRLLYAFRVLHTHGLPSVSLQDVFRSTILAKIQYCSPAWSGYCSATDRARLDWFLKRCKRHGFMHQSPNSSMTLIIIEDSMLAYLKTVNMFCGHSYMIVLFYNINLGNSHIIRSWYLKQLNWMTVTLLSVCCTRTVINFTALRHFYYSLFL